MNEWKKIWLAEEAHAFSGWDFSHIDGRYDETPLPWDYREIALDGLKPCHRLLDMGTGGGEFMLGLGHPLENVSVTEGYAPNLKLCRERLSPLGVDVHGANGDGPLPFGDNTFDRVLNRHDSFGPQEVYRVLKPGSVFITQQVGGKNNRELSERLIDGFEPHYPHHDLAHNVELLKDVGFEILRAEEHFGPMRFYDTGALVFFTKNVQWEYPGFSVEKCWDRLLDVQREIEEKGFVEGTEHRFLIVARKNG